MVALAKGRNDVADIAWGLGFLLIALVSFFSNGIAFGRGLLAAILVGIWAVRLSAHIYLRNRGRGEDYRYKAWREEWGGWFYFRTYFQVFLLQGLLMLVVASPVVMANVYRGGKAGLVDIIGLAVWLIGFFFEATGDWQLARFINNPANKGKILQTGLWRYTRHPNYFGEVAQWWGIWLIALSAPFGWAAIAGPLTITWLILKVSGIPLLEKKMQGNPEFEEYKKRVSPFFPWPSRRA